MEKVKVSKEVAEAIEELRCIVRYHGYWRAVMQFEEKDDVDLRFVRMRSYFNEDVSLFIRALFGDYEVEKTPEEEIAELYLDCHKTMTDSVAHKDYDKALGISTGITFTLDALGIKIKGVNA